MGDCNVQAPHFEVLAVHDHVVEPEQDREPILDHRVISRGVVRLLEPAIGALQHGWDDIAKHSDGQQADLLIFAHFAEVGDADGQIRKRTVADYG